MIGDLFVDFCHVHNLAMTMEKKMTAEALATVVKSLHKLNANAKIGDLRALLAEYEATGPSTNIELELGFRAS